MGEPATVKERMEALGWVFEADYDPDGEKLIAGAIKLRPSGRTASGTPTSDVVAYHTDAAYREDHAACRAAWAAEWDAQSAPATPTP